ncbi:MAG: hypothetical protein K2M03_08835, partial [Muribaculaceae bacterium]|nr:hypothetical protein [Muribaculaceae bacterium]
FSADGQCLAWLSMERDGYEADRNRLFVMDMQSGERHDLTAEWDYTIDEFAWRPDGKALYFIAPKDGVTPVFSIDAASGAVKTLIQETADYTSLAVIGNDALLTMRAGESRDFLTTPPALMGRLYARRGLKPNDILKLNITTSPLK